MTEHRGRRPGAGWPAAIPALALALALAWAVVGCGVLGPTGAPAVTPSTSAAGPPGTAESATASPPEPGLGAATGVLDGGSGEVTGRLGSYTLDGRGSDAPWFPFDGLPVAQVIAQGHLAIRIADGGPIRDWSAALAAEDDPTGADPRVVNGPGRDLVVPSITIGPMPAGRWVLAVRLSRADGRGEGTTYWAIVVGE